MLCRKPVRIKKQWTTKAIKPFKPALISGSRASLQFGMCDELIFHQGLFLGRLPRNKIKDTFLASKKFFLAFFCYLRFKDFL